MEADISSISNDNILMQYQNLLITLKDIPLNLLDESNTSENITIFNGLIDFLDFNTKNLDLVLKYNSVIIDFYFNNSNIENYTKDVIIINSDKFPKKIYFYYKFYIFFYYLLHFYYFKENFLLIRFPQILSCPKINNIDKIEYNLNQKSSNNSNKLNEKISKLLSQINNSNSHNLLNYDLFEYNNLCFAGTFDHYHIGHNLLLQISVLLSKNIIYIGITDNKMATKKSPNFLVQNENFRKKYINYIIEINGKFKNTKTDIRIIHDGIDFSGTDASLEALVLTEETFKGGKYVNDARLKNGIKELKLVNLNVIKMDENDDSKKVSSSLMRNEILKNLDKEKMEELYNIWKKIGGVENIKEEKILDFWDLVRDSYVKIWRGENNGLKDLYERVMKIWKNNENNKGMIWVFFEKMFCGGNGNENEGKNKGFYNKYLSGE